MYLFNTKNHGNSLALKTTCTLAMAFGIAACQTEPIKSNVPEEVLGDLKIQMHDMSYEPTRLDVPREGRYRINVQNTSQVPHDIVFDNGITLKISPGGIADTEIDIPVEGLAYRCSLPGHEQAGMKGEVTVNGQEPSSAREHLHKPSTSITPEYVSPVAPELLPGKLHSIELTAIEKDMAVAKDAVQNLWTYNGQVPGPVIHIKVGDIVRVHLVNPSSNKLPHSVDFHASQVAWNDEMTSINPGEEKNYEWKADYAGVWMYHCGTSPALHHIASGHVRHGYR